MFLYFKLDFIQTRKNNRNLTEKKKKLDLVKKKK